MSKFAEIQQVWQAARLGSRRGAVVRLGQDIPNLVTPSPSLPSVSVALAESQSKDSVTGHPTSATVAKFASPATPVRTRDITRGTNYASQRNITHAPVICNFGHPLRCFSTKNSGDDDALDTTEKKDSAKAHGDADVESNSTPASLPDKEHPVESAAQVEAEDEKKQKESKDSNVQDDEATLDSLYQLIKADLLRLESKTKEARHQQQNRSQQNAADLVDKLPETDKLYVLESDAPTTGSANGNEVGDGYDQPNNRSRRRSSRRKSTHDYDDEDIEEWGEEGFSTTRSPQHAFKKSHKFSPDNLQDAGDRSSQYHGFRSKRRGKPLDQHLEDPDQIEGKEKRDEGTRKSRSLRRALQEQSAAEALASQVVDDDDAFSEEFVVEYPGKGPEDEERVTRAMRQAARAFALNGAKSKSSLPSLQRGPSPSAPPVLFSQKGTSPLPLDPESTKPSERIKGGLTSNAGGINSANGHSATIDATTPVIPPPQTPSERRVALQLAGGNLTDRKVAERYAKYLDAINKVRESIQKQSDELSPEEFERRLELLRSIETKAEAVLKTADDFQFMLENGLLPEKGGELSNTDENNEESKPGVTSPSLSMLEDGKSANIEPQSSKSADESPDQEPPQGRGGMGGNGDGNGDGDGDGNGDDKVLPKVPKSYTPVPLNFRPLPHSSQAPRMSNVIAVGITQRPLFPGLYCPVTIRNPELIAAIKRQSESSLPYVGVFLKRSQDPANFLKQRGAISPSKPSEPPLRLTSLPKTLGSLLNNKNGSVQDEGKTDILEDSVRAEELYDVGTFAQIFRTDTLADGSLSVILVGLRRIRSLGVKPQPVDEPESEKNEKDEGKQGSAEGVQPKAQKKARPNVLELMVTHADEPKLSLTKSGIEGGDPEYQEELVRAYMSEIMATIREVIKRHHVFQEQLGFILNTIDWHNPESVADVCASLTLASPEVLQDVLETWDVTERLNKALLLLRKELELAKLQQNINKTVDEALAKLNRKHLVMEQIKHLRKEAGLDNERDTIRKRFYERIKDKQLPVEVAQVISDEFARLSTLETSSSEFNVARNYLDWLTSLPWGEYSQDMFDIDMAAKILDEDHYGMEDVKQRILEFIASSKLCGTTPKGKVMLFVGPPGVGKTSIGKSIARALGREFYRFSVGGVHDVADVKGHRRTYIGALPGRLVQALKKTKTMNPVILIDEIDKMGRGSLHGDPAAALLEVLDPEQNSNFLDHYLDVPLDLSRVLFLCTANTLDTISAPLLDRMDVIRLSGYVAQEKEQIAKNYLLPASRASVGVSPEAANITPEAIRHLIKWYSREAGVRNLKNLIDKMYRKVAYQLVKAGAKSAVGLNAMNDQLMKQRFEEKRTAAAAAATAAAATAAAAEVAAETATTANSTSLTASENDTSATPKEKTGSSEDKPKQPQITVDVHNLTEFVGQPAFTEERLYDRTPVGVVMGLAWNNAGGAILYLESEISDSFRKLRKPYSEPIPYVIDTKPTPAPAQDESNKENKDNAPSSNVMVIPSNPSTADGDEKGSHRGGSLVVTGQLGDVMKESTTIAYTLAKAYLARLYEEHQKLKNDPAAIAMPVLETAATKPLTQHETFREAIRSEYARKHGLTGEAAKTVLPEGEALPPTYVYAPSATFFADHQIHIHVPQGATPKDGPSAGIALVTCLLSQALNRPLVPEIAMTGEVTLTGKVLPIGGVKEKLIAAKRAGIHHIIVPRANLPDVNELPAYITADLTIYFADVYDHVLRLALGCPDALGGRTAEPPLIKVFPTQAELDAQAPAKDDAQKPSSGSSTDPNDKPSNALNRAMAAGQRTILGANLFNDLFLD